MDIAASLPAKHWSSDLNFPASALQTQQTAHLLPDAALKLGLVVAVQFAALVLVVDDSSRSWLLSDSNLCSIALPRTHVDVGSALNVGLGEHAEDREQHAAHTLYGRPALAGRLVPQRIVAGRVQDRDADGSVGVDCGQ